MSWLIFKLGHQKLWKVRGFTYTIEINVFFGQRCELTEKEWIALTKERTLSK